MPAVYASSNGSGKTAYVRGTSKKLRGHITFDSTFYPSFHLLLVISRISCNLLEIKPSSLVGL